MMMRLQDRPVLAALVWAALALPASAATVADVNARIDAVLGSHARYETTIEAFQQAVADGRREDVAAFVRYPIVVSIEGRRRTIRSSAEFVRNYSAIMTPDIVGAIKNQKYQDLFVNAQGIMFGNGEAWINGICLARECRQWVPKVVTLQHTGD